MEVEQLDRSLEEPDGSWVDAGTVEVGVKVELQGPPGTACQLAPELAGEGDEEIGLFQTIIAPDNVTLAWSDPADGDHARGDLATVSSYVADSSGSFNAATSLDIAGDNPVPGTGIWYLIKSAGIGGAACNEISTWSSGGSGEAAGLNLALP